MELISSPTVPSSHASVCLSSTVTRLLAVVAVATVAVTSSLQLLPVTSGPAAAAAAGAPGRAGCVMFNFGDSNSDTGGFVAGAGFRLSRPFGRRFSDGVPAGRFSDGRLYIDFLCERLRLDHLSPYLESSGVSFRHGANFAAAGATAAPSAGPFSLPTQVRQFRHFKRRTAELRPRGIGSGISADEFETAVYSFDIGQNDISEALLSANLTHENVLLRAIPAIITSITNAVKAVYETGGRKFVIYNTGPLGCLPSTLARRRAGDLDDGAGCLARHNGVARALNARLRRLRRELAGELPDATFVGVDMYAIKYGLIADHTTRGFSHPLTACCGAGGPPYNYAPRTACGTTKAACSESDAGKYISWDGVHYTEAANEAVAGEILSSQHNTPRIGLQTLCTSENVQ